MKNRKEQETQDYAAKYYEEQRYTKGYSVKYQNWWSKKMIDLVGPNGKILDVGCGTGYFAEKFLSKYDVMGVDISEEMIRYAQTRMKKAVQGDAQNMPFPDNTFDVVIARSLLHHLPDPKQGAKEIKRVLKNGGRVIFADTHNSFLSDLPRKIMYKKNKHFSDEHKNFKEEELIKIIGSELTIIKKYYFGYIAYPLMGFPDVLDVFKYFPLKKILITALIKFDELMSKIPVIKKQSFGIMILAEKQ
jgi:ubiquinone/menaquinone biosynthesis C-methylase UbiE